MTEKIRIMDNALSETTATRHVPINVTHTIQHSLLSNSRVDKAVSRPERHRTTLREAAIEEEIFVKHMPAGVRSLLKDISLSVSTGFHTARGSSLTVTVQTQT
ncbi:hypothetical protein J6590_043208 [Homalodisca vitripennis]|nr:hypothetical protein J6590_043208 [Homalodisca vitripennis]